MNKCSLFYPKCFWCEQHLYKNGPTILYKFKGCGKYHNKIMCNLCFTKKYDYKLYENHNLSNRINNDPLGMSIYIHKKLN